MNPLEALEQLLGAVAQAIALMGMLFACLLAAKFAAHIVEAVIDAFEGGGKPKNESPLSRFSVPYDQDLDDETPKTYMTIGDDGELVEMEE